MISFTFCLIITCASVGGPQFAVIMRLTSVPVLVGKRIGCCRYSPVMHSFWERPV